MSDRTAPTPRGSLSRRCLAWPRALDAQETRQYRYVMGTSVEVQAFGADEATRRAAIDEAFAAFAEVDRLMSNYRDRQRARAREPRRQRMAP